MITVKVYGLLRIDSGIRERSMEAETVREVLTNLEQAGIQRKALDRCVILVNGVSAGKRTKLNSGDVVQFLPPVAGG